ncbi:MAG: type I DNA topoisomerase [Candidatus Poribacteria bacterium]|nr:type I DNA topoisomerase [Candidatus Poribacteria bacterium]
MPKSLIVVESPAKAKTINKFLGKDFVVKASMGHVRDLPSKELGVDVDNEFAPKYTLIHGKRKVIKELRAAAEKVDSIYLAADPDREGEAICWHLAHELKKTKKPVFRITYNEITKGAIQAAVDNPAGINQSLFDAQQTRRILDRLVGYQISPILWQNVKPGLSAGRVQSVAVRLICEREAEIDAFEAKEYWTITATLKGDEPSPFDAKLFRIGSEKAAISTYGFTIDETRATEIVDEAKTEKFVVKDIQKRERKRRPVPPFITSTLQQEAARKLRFTARRTMSVAQQLYEGLDVGSQGSIGLITYMRTDSTRVANEALNEARGYIQKTYGSDYLPSRAIHYRGRSSAQDAHEAIRPTSAVRTPESLRSHLSSDQYRLYDLIWKRFIASQMNPAILDQTTIDVSAGGYLFRATGSVIKFRGFMAVYMESSDEVPIQNRGESDEEAILPPVEVGQVLNLLKLDPKQHFTQPPPRYTEATLVKELEAKEIGRPSTYASIISTIQDREYVVKEKGSFLSTDIGKLVNELLIKGFPNILEVQFTAKLEEQLDTIADGKVDWVKVLSDFYQPFHLALEAAPDRMYKARKDMEEESDEICDKCGSKMIVKWGRYSRFLGCSSFPECRNTKSLEAESEKPAEPEETDEVCDKCGEPMVIRTSRAGGKFLSCTGYPKCKNAKPINIGIDCPESGCGGYLGERRSRRGKPFYGCSNYPDCNFAVWDKPLPQKCPQCDALFILEKTTKAKGKHLVCYDEACGYTQLLDDPESGE